MRALLKYIAEHALPGEMITNPRERELYYDLGMYDKGTDTFHPTPEEVLFLYRKIVETARQYLDDELQAGKDDQTYLYHEWYDETFEIPY